MTSLTKKALDRLAEFVHGHPDGSLRHRLRQPELVSALEVRDFDAAWPWLQGAKGRGVDLATLPATQRWVECIAARSAVGRAKAVVNALETPDIPKLLRERSDALDRYLGRGRYSRPDS